MRILIFILFFIFYSCSEHKLTLQKWDASFYDQELINNAYEIALVNYDEGKRFTDLSKLKFAEDEFTRLVQTYSHSNSTDKLKELNGFKNNYLNYYKGMIQKLDGRGFIFTTAGYYKKILKLYPDNQEAKDYINLHSTTIEKRLKRNLDLGFNFINQSKFSDAKRCFNRVLNFNPNSSDARRGLYEIERRRKLQRYKKTTTNKNNNITLETVSKQLLESIPKMTEDEKNNLYNLGIKAFENREYLKAYEFFESIDDVAYRETSLYLSRAEDKLNESGIADSE